MSRQVFKLEYHCPRPLGRSLFGDGWLEVLVDGILFLVAAADYLFQ